MSGGNIIRDRLLGAWRLIGWKSISGGSESDFLPPLGLAKDAGGYLFYSPSGEMSVTLSLKDRPPFADISLDAGTSEQKAGAFATFINYCGKFEFNEQTSEITHIVEFALQPSLVGQRLRRIALLDGHRLRLDTPAVKIGGQWHAGYIEWDMCAPAKPDRLQA